MRRIVGSSTAAAARRRFWSGPGAAASHYLQGVVECRRPLDGADAKPVFKRHAMMRRTVTPPDGSSDDAEATKGSVVDLIIIGPAVGGGASLAPGQAEEPVIEIEMESAVESCGMIITAASSEHSELEPHEAFVARFEMVGEPYLWTRSVGITSFASGGRSASEVVFTNRGMTSFVDIYDPPPQSADEASLPTEEEEEESVVAMTIQSTYTICEQSEWEEARRVLEAT